MSFKVCSEVSTSLQSDPLCHYLFTDQSHVYFRHVNMLKYANEYNSVIAYSIASVCE